MSLFDYVRCLYPLPDGWDPGGRLFQTNDTPAQCLETYSILQDGRLWHEASDTHVLHHGVLTFGVGNVTATAPHGYITNDSEDAWYAEYRAFYDHGRLERLTGARQAFTLPGMWIQVTHDLYLLGHERR